MSFDATLSRAADWLVPANLQGEQSVTLPAHATTLRATPKGAQPACKKKAAGRSAERPAVPARVGWRGQIRPSHNKRRCARTVPRAAEIHPPANKSIFTEMLRIGSRA